MELAIPFVETICHNRTYEVTLQQIYLLINKSSELFLFLYISVFLSLVFLVFIIQFKLVYTILVSHELAIKVSFAYSASEQTNPKLHHSWHSRRPQEVRESL